MPPRPAATVSKAQADRAADRIRKLVARVMRGGRSSLTIDELDALRIINAFRTDHAYPLTKVTMGVRVMIQTELGPLAPRPSQRLKRMSRIIDKLLRPGLATMRLSQMEDIGGCRAVLATIDDLRAVEERIRWRWARRGLVDVIDYIDRPKDDGYRAVHIVTRRDGQLVEIQLRTERQHRWADGVEDAQALTGFNVKDGDGPKDLRRYFELAAERLALDDQGSPPDSELEREFGKVREEIRHYYTAT